MPNYTVEAVAGHDPDVIQQLLLDGSPVGVQVKLLNTWSGHYIDTGTFVDPDVLNLTAGKRVEVAFGEMEGLSTTLANVVGNRVLVVDEQLGEAVPAGDVLWILDQQVAEADLPPTPLEVTSQPAQNFPFQLGGADGANYLKGDLGMSRLLKREPVYDGPGDLSEIPVPMKTKDKVPTAHGWQFPMGSKYFFDETEGVEYILLEDISGNYDRFDIPTDTRTHYQKKRYVIIVPKDGIEISIMCPFLHTESYKDTQMDVGQDLRITVERDATIRVKRDAEITVDRDCTVEVGRDLEATVEGDADVEVDGDLTVEVGGQATLKATGSVIVRGATIELN